ncbi:aminodeoxychorismate synthase component I [Rhodobacteraceae bacterium S2214]|nr:aminodeoxychorismate synthase component I [Rhodobacteraceae bacterium S2214]
MTRSVQFDRGPLLSGSLFHQADHIIAAWHPEEVDKALCEMQAAQAEGKWLAGTASYELGYVLNPKLRPRLPGNRQDPLLCFGVFDQVHPATDTKTAGMANLGRFEPEWDFQTYQEAFDVIHRYIRNGDIYQANLTFPMVAHCEGSPRSLYEALKRKQPVPFGAFVDLSETKLLCRSPELFFSLSSGGQLRARPMKGTIKRGLNADEDANLKAQLANSEKDQAENLMITDLLRNDFSRISQIGSVRVPALFHVESYATVHQMISEVTAEIRPDCKLSDILTAIFPCGSITGAPKLRAMEILSDIESDARDTYCGAVGWIAPDGAMEFNVAIRTLICRPSGKVKLNVGGGIVYDSTAESEYSEALLKAQFAEL